MVSEYRPSASDNWPPLSPLTGSVSAPAKVSVTTVCPEPLVETAADKATLLPSARC